MGLLVEGKWKDQWYDTSSTGGRFVRSDAAYRNWVTADGSPGPTGEGGFKAEPGRYLLYVSYACPWANRTLILRTLKGLEHHIGVSVVNPYMGENGWTFEPAPGGGARPRIGGPVPVPSVFAGESAVYRPRHGADTVGPGTRHHCQQ